MATKDSGFVTIRDVAQAAGVSVATASRVLSERGRASKETRAKVWRAATQLGYKPNLLARGLKRQKTDTVGLVITDIVNPFYADLASGVLNCAKQFGYHVILCATNEDEQQENEYLQILMNQRAAGIIAVPTGRNLEIWTDALAKGVKLVLVDRELEGLSQADTVLLDNFSGAYDAVSYLIGLGHLRIAIINGPTTTTTGKERLAGYVKAMETAGLSLSDEYISVGSFKISGGYSAARQLLALPEPPTAIFAANNQLGQAAFKVMHEQGLSVPEDISLIVFDDVAWASLVDPPLTVVSQPTYAMGYFGMEALHRKLELGSDAPYDVPKKLILPPKLVARASCCAPRDTAPADERRQHMADLQQNPFET
ncbi:MAG: LacI family DNA-binding transcriptional regulator [Caldilineaceae bacterium]|nr:LacI family DNA-binding transcriptional regulator [Caldilineaceae bacterium]